MMKTPRLCILGIYLLLTSQTTYSLVLLSTNIDDVRQLAKQFVSAPLAEKIANFLAKATVIKTVDISEENYRNNLGDKLSDSEWNRAGKRQSLRNDEINNEADDRNRVSGKRGRIVLGMNREDGMQRDLILDRPSLVQTKKNFVYDYALRQDSAKEPNFEWKKAANFDFLAVPNQRNLFDTSNIYAHVPDLAKTPNLVKSTKDDVYEIKKPAKEGALDVFNKIEKPADKNTYLSIIKENNKLAKIETYSDEIKETRKPIKADTYLKIIKESPKSIEFKKDLDAPKKGYKSTTKTTISKPMKKQSKLQSDIERMIDKNNIETDDESWETDRVRNRKPKAHGFTRFADYYETTETTKDVVNKPISEGSIYTKESVLATSGPVELLKASVKLVYSSDENSLNDENRNYFKEYDSESASRFDFRRHLEPKSVKNEVATTVQTRFTTPVSLEDANEVNSVNEDNVAVTEDNPHRTTDPEERPRTGFRYGGARVYNNVEHEQAAEDFARSE